MIQKIMSEEEDILEKIKELLNIKESENERINQESRRLGRGKGLT